MRIRNAAVIDVSDTIATVNARGLRIQDCLSGTLARNTATGNLESGIYLAANTYDGNSGSQNVVVANNTVHANKNNGILVIGGKNNTLQDNDIRDNYNTAVMGWHTYSLTIKDNFMQGNGQKNIQWCW